MTRRAPSGANSIARTALTEDRNLSVVPLYDGAMAHDIAGSLRRSAESVEAETEADNRTVAMVAVQVGEDGKVQVYGWGRTDRFHTLGALVKAMAVLT